jgi:hypothetical protein
MMKRMTINRLITVMILLLNCPLLYAQQVDSGDDVLLQKFNYYSVKQFTPLLYVHFDKNVYTNSEQVWFTGYLLKSSTELSKYNTLAVALVKDDDQKVVLEEKYYMADGLSFGNMLLPDSIAPGNYHFMAYTNVLHNGKPEDVFLQPITIKTTSEQSFNASLRLLDTARSYNGPARLLVNVSSKDMRVLPNAEVEYFIGKEKSVKARSDMQGEYMITIPKDKLTLGNGSVVRVTVKHNKEVKNLSLKLPAYNRNILIKFYPEGGNLVEGVLNTVGWEARTPAGQPLKLNAVIYKDNKPADTVSTGIFGIGRFKLRPQPGSSYYVKLLTDNTTANEVYFLPKAKDAMPAITISKAIANDTLTIQLSSLMPQKVRVLIHRYTQPFADIERRTNRRATLLKVVLSEVPKGINTVTVLDSLGRPIAERLFFAHYDQKPVLQISTDKQQYTTRQKVDLKLKLTKAITGNVENALVSIAVVQNSRIESTRQTDMESYVYLNHPLETLPADPFGRGITNKEYLEDILLVKGWRRYKWQDLMEATAADTTKDYKSPRFTGMVRYFDKPLKKPILLTALRDSGITMLGTDSSGNFELKPELITTSYNQKMVLIVSAKSQDGYVIDYKDPYRKISQQTADEQLLSDAGYSQVEQISKDQVLKGFERSIILKEVVIKGANNGSANNGSPYGASKNECGDYVCMYNILNCSNHPWGGTLPKKGEKYMTKVNGVPQMIVYHGCVISENEDKNYVNIKGIYTNREFYGSDYSKVNPMEPEYFSTIYWNHGLKFNSDNEVNLSFYASDITGPFKVIVQGLSDNDVIYSEHNFTVKKP